MSEINEFVTVFADIAGLSHMPGRFPDMADLYKCADFELELFTQIIVVDVLNQLQGIISEDGEIYKKIIDRYGIGE